MDEHRPPPHFNFDVPRGIDLTLAAGDYPRQAAAMQARIGVPVAPTTFDRVMAAALDLAFSWSTTTSPVEVAISQILDRRSRPQPGSPPRPRAAGTS